MLYATGAAINTAVKLYLYATKYLGARKWKPNEIITYSVPVKNDIDEEGLQAALKSYSTNDHETLIENARCKVVSAIAIRLERRPFDPKISKQIKTKLKK